ncbi:MAG: LysR substrate-binding domain-containing protein [Alphaproteobacteria bacterium]
MNLRDLHYFLAVAENRNFKKAADACNISQPTLSMQIKKMEEYLGVRLFERTNKSVLITDTGRRIEEAARRIVQDEQQIFEIARMVRDPASGEFKLGAIPTLASYVFPSYVPAIAKSFLKLQLLLVEEKTEVLIEQLKTGKIDAALLALPIEEATLDQAKLFDDPFLLAVGAEHPLAKRKNVRLADLAGHKLLLLDEGHCLRDQALSVCRAHGAEEEQSFRATSLETLRLMVQAPHSDLMTLIPAVAVSPGDKLHYIPFTGASPSRSVGLVWRKTSARADMIVKMADALIAARK